MLPEAMGTVDFDQTVFTGPDQPQHRIAIPGEARTVSAWLMTPPVPPDEPVLALLQQRRMEQPPDAWVFARHDGLKPILVNAAFVIACKRAGIKDFVFHDLRHTTASWLALSGASLRDIAEVLGHKTISMSMKYTHLTTDHTAGVLGRMADRFLAPPPEGGAHADR